MCTACIQAKHKQKINKVETKDTTKPFELVHSDVCGPFLQAHICRPSLVLATVPVLGPAGFIGLHGNGLTPSKIDDFLSEPSL
jgi:hypothetical protein